MPYLICPSCSLTIPEPPVFAPRTCARCRLVKDEHVQLRRVERRPGTGEPESSDEADQAAIT